MLNVLVESKVTMDLDCSTQIKTFSREWFLEVEEIKRRHKSIKFVQILMFFQALVLVFKSSNLSKGNIFIRTGHDFKLDDLTCVNML